MKLIYKITAYLFFIHAASVLLLDFVLIYIGVYDSSTPTVDPQGIPIHWLIVIWACVWPYWAYFLMLLGSIMAGIAFWRLSLGMPAKMFLVLWLLLLILPASLLFSGYYVTEKFASWHYYYATKTFMFSTEPFFVLFELFYRIYFSLIPVLFWFLGLNGYFLWKAKSQRRSD